MTKTIIYYTVGLKLFPAKNKKNENDIFHGYISHEFRGTIIGIKEGFFQVKDQDDNVYDVEEADMNFIGCPIN